MGSDHHRLLCDSPPLFHPNHCYSPFASSDHHASGRHGSRRSAALDIRAGRATPTRQCRAGVGHRERAERKGRNPQSGEEITIKAAKTPTFKAGKSLKDAVN